MLSEFYDQDELEELSDFSDAGLSMPSAGDFNLAPLGSTTWSEDSVRVIRQSKGADGLVELLAKINDGTRQASVEIVVQALELLADGETSLVTLRPKDAVETVEPLLVKYEGNVQVARLTCSLFGMLAFCDANKTELVGNGAGRLIVGVMQAKQCSRNEKLMCLSIETICTLVQHADNEVRSMLVGDGCLGAVVDVMGLLPASLELQACGCRLIELMAFGGEHRGEIVKMGGLGVITAAVNRFLKCSNEIVTHGCHALYFLVFEIEQMAMDGYNPTIIQVINILSVIVGKRVYPSETRAQCSAIIASVIEHADRKTLNQITHDQIVKAVLLSMHDIGNEDGQVLVDGLTIFYKFALENVCKEHINEKDLKEIINITAQSMSEKLEDDSVQKMGQSIISTVSAILGEEPKNEEEVKKQDLPSPTPSEQQEEEEELKYGTSDFEDEEEEEEEVSSSDPDSPKSPNQADGEEEEEEELNESSSSCSSVPESDFEASEKRRRSSVSTVQDEQEYAQENNSVPSLVSPPAKSPTFVKGIVGCSSPNLNVVQTILNADLASSANLDHGSLMSMKRHDSAPSPMIAKSSPRSASPLSGRKLGSPVKHPQQDQYETKLKEMKEQVQQTTLNFIVRQQRSKKLMFAMHVLSLNVLQNQVKELQDTLAQRARDHETALKELQSERDSMDQYLKDQKSKSKELQQVLSRERTTRASLEGEVASLRFDKAHSDDTFKELETAVSKATNLEAEVQHARSRVEKLSTENEELRDDLVCLENRVQTAELQSRRKESQLETALQELEDLKASNESLQEKNVQLEAKLKARESAHQTRRRESMEDLQSQVRGLQEQLSMERERALQMQAQKVELIKSQLNTESKMVIKAMSASKARLEERLEKLESENANLQARIDDLMIQKRENLHQVGNDTNLQRDLVSSSPKMVPSWISPNKVQVGTPRQQQQQQDQQKSDLQQQDGSVDELSLLVDELGVSKVEDLPFAEKLAKLFESLHPIGAAITYTTMYHFTKLLKLLPPKFQRANLDVIFASIAEKTKRKAKIDLNGFVHTLNILARKLSKAGKIEKIGRDPGFRKRWVPLASLLALERVEQYLIKQELEQSRSNDQELLLLEEKTDVRFAESDSSSEEEENDDDNEEEEEEDEGHNAFANGCKGEEKNGNEDYVISNLWSKETKPLRDMFALYAKRERDMRKPKQTSQLDNRTVMHHVHHGIDFDGIAQFGLDFDIIPTLFGRQELHRVFVSTLNESKSRHASLTFSLWIRFLEKVAIMKFPRSNCPTTDYQVAALLQWMDASNGKLKLRNRVRSGIVVRKFANVRLDHLF